MPRAMHWTEVSILSEAAKIWAMRSLRLLDLFFTPLKTLLIFSRMLSVARLVLISNRGDPEWWSKAWSEFMKKMVTSIPIFF
jgi:hypothetical protein